MNAECGRAPESGLGHRKSVYQESVRSKLATTGAARQNCCRRCESGRNTCESVGRQSVWTRRVLPVGNGEKPPNSGRKKLPQESACVFRRFCQSRDCPDHCSCSSVFRRPASKRVFSFLGHWFPSEECTQKGPARNRTGPIRVCLIPSRSARATQPTGEFLNNTTFLNRNGSSLS